MHLNAWTSDPFRVAKDVSVGMKRVRGLDHAAYLFRPPFGKITSVGIAQIWRSNLQIGWWTVDSRDSWSPRPTDEVLNEIESKGGGVILMHDDDTYERAPDHDKYVLELTERILLYARQNGLNVISYGSLVRTSYNSQSISVQ
jgi:peptidoglycan/xylan/chitin deacetylase (PgdA/CDA1 family)